ncbi:MAG TPA: hypothetical protein VGD40_25350 [Chryseosolibacter sp.]
MKTLLKSFLLIAIGALASFSFITYQTRPANRDVRICHDCTSEAFRRVSLKQLMYDIARYKGTHVKQITPEMAAHTYQESAARSCTYSLDTLKKFICLIETYSKKANIKPQELAIRFFYGVYPKKEIVNDEKYGSLHTLFMIPAVFEPSTGTYVEFDPQMTAEPKKDFLARLSKTQFKSSFPFYALRDLAPYALLDDAIDVLVLDSRAIPKKSKYLRRSSAPESGSFSVAQYSWNQGMLCPPNCPTTDFLSTVDGSLPSVSW